MTDTPHPTRAMQGAGYIDAPMFFVIELDRVEAPALRRIAQRLTKSAGIMSNIDNEFMDRLHAWAQGLDAERIEQLEKLANFWATAKNEIVAGTATELRTIAGDAVLPEPTKQ